MSTCWYVEERTDPSDYLAFGSDLIKNKAHESLRGQVGFINMLLIYGGGSLPNPACVIGRRS